MTMLCFGVIRRLPNEAAPKMGIVIVVWAATVSYKGRNWSYSKHQPSIFALASGLVLSQTRFSDAFQISVL